MTLTEFFNDYYKPLKLRGRSPATVRLYRNTLIHYERFLNKPPTIETDLSDLQVCRYLEYRSSKRSAYTAEKERNQLCAMWRCAADLRMKETRPMIPVTPIPTRVPSAWSIDQLKTLVTTSKAMPGMIGDVPARIWWPALIQVLWQSAERVGAILSVRKDDYMRPRMLVRAEYRKGGKRDQLYTFSDSVCDLLDILMTSSNGPQLFSWPKQREYMWDRFGRIVTAAGLGGGRRVKFHQLRRSAATHYAARGGDATALLDHSNPRITRAYLDPRFIDTGPKPCDILPELE